MRQSRVARVVGTPALTAAVDPTRRVSEGALVQASVRARLLGIPLLRLDATVALMPAAITAPSPHSARGMAWPRLYAASTTEQRCSPRCAGTAGADVLLWLSVEARDTGWGQLRDLRRRVSRSPRMSAESSLSSGCPSGGVGCELGTLPHLVS